MRVVKKNPNYCSFYLAQYINWLVTSWRDRIYKSVQEIVFLVDVLGIGKPSKTYLKLRDGKHFVIDIQGVLNHPATFFFFSKIVHRIVPGEKYWYVVF